MAEFGFFGYDWRDRKRGYQRLTVPTVPRRVEELPALLARICRLVAIDTEFARARHIDVRSIPEEVVWPTVSTNRLL